MGIYAVVRIEEFVTQQQKANSSITSAQLDTQLNSLYQSILSNPAISGLTLQVHWDTLNPNALPAANAYDWSSVDDAFTQASSAKKTIQLIVMPGFQSPQWVLNQLSSCDGLFQTPSTTPPSTCGKVTFTGNEEATDGTVLPLPWNPTYKSAWQTFLMALNARYGSNPAFVSIAVAGPTAASAEMIMPSDGTAAAQTQFGGIQPDDMWLKLLTLQYPGQTAYQNSDQAFIDEWDAAIDMYGKIFSNLTLVATTGSGLPNLNKTGFTIPSAFSGDCNKPDMDCAAETTILSHFMDPSVGGNNSKATQTSGMEASRANGFNLGVGSVKFLSQRTAELKPPSAQILGGAQFNKSFSNDAALEGCTTKGGCANGITPEQAEYNVLNVFFDGTAVASSFGGTPGNAPLNYLQIYSPDIQYATAHINAPVQITQANGTTVMMTAQNLLNLASQKLLQIAETKPAP